MSDTSAATDLSALREDVAMGNRIVHAAGLVTGWGHISGRIPGTNTFLFPTRASPALARPERLLVLDTDGHILSGDGEPNTEFWIHARVYAARPDVNSVAHVHSPACVIVGQIGQTVQVMHNTASAFSDGIPVFERPGLIRSTELGDQVAATLGSKRAMLLRGHGANVADRDVRRTVVLACILEEAADYQLRALAAVGGDASRISWFNPDELARVREQTDAPSPMARGWDYYVALVEKRL
jgi:ribulose-5-phosphate 4-epimerase/fuculose-1-phosphate aldolase